MTTFTRATAVIAAAILSTSLAACSLTGSKDDASDQESATSQETDAGAQSTGATAGSTKEAPSGYQTVTTSMSGISFAVPEGWQVVTGDDVQNGQSLPLPVATYGLTEDQARLLLASVDLAATSPTPNDAGLPDGVSVTPAVGVSSLPSEDEMSQRANERGAAPGEYSTAQTGLGQVAVMTATATASEIEMHSTTITAPTPSGSWVDITVMTSDASRTQEMTDTIVSTLS